METFTNIIQALENFPLDHPQFVGTFLAASAMLITIGLNRQGLVAFWGVIFGSIFTPYMTAEFAVNNFGKSLIISGVSPIFFGFLLIHIIENRKAVSTKIYKEIIKRVLKK